MHKTRAPLAALAVAAAMAGLPACGDSDEDKIKKDVQKQIDETQKDVQREIDEASKGIERQSKGTDDRAEEIRKDVERDVNRKIDEAQKEIGE